MTTTPHETPSETDSPMARACAIARGEITGPELPAIAGYTVGSKDVSARGSVRHWWYRMVWRSSEWVYPSDRRLPRATFLAADRRAKIYADMYEGDLLIEHDRGRAIDTGDTAARLIVVLDDGPTTVHCAVARLRSGQLRITLPDGSTIDRPDPRMR